MFYEIYVCADVLQTVLRKTVMYKLPILRQFAFIARSNAYI